VIKLREYQSDMIGKIRHALREHDSVMAQAPTGAGKTAMATDMMHSVTEKNKRGFFVCHRRELIDQTAGTFKKNGIPFGYIANGYPANFYQPIQICSIDSLKNRLDVVPKPDLCIWDEAHHLGAAGWAKVHKFYGNSKHVGLSATPQRLDGKGLDDRFDFLVPGPSVSWLIDNNFLAKYKLYSIPGADMSGVHTRMGDFVKSETEEVMDNKTIIGDMVNHWKRYASDKLTIGFAVSIKHSEHIVEQFNAAGIPAVHLDAKTKKEDRKNILRSFARGDYKVVFNVGLFAEGFDIAANSGMDVTVGCVIDAAPTQSLCNWLQRCGRALRPQDTPAIILDHAGNYGRHGAPCQDRQWSLLGREKNGRSPSDNEPTIQTKQCPECFAVHKPMPSCPECGHVYEAEGRIVEEISGSLQEIDPEAIRRQMVRDRGAAKTPEALQDFAKKQGYKEGYADHVAKARAEKKSLQDMLYNLSIGAKSMGVSVDISMGDIMRMKPKQLKSTIADLKSEMGV